MLPEERIPAEAITTWDTIAPTTQHTTRHGSSPTTESKEADMAGPFDPTAFPEPDDLTRRTFLKTTSGIATASAVAPFLAETAAAGAVSYTHLPLPTILLV